MLRNVQFHGRRTQAGASLIEVLVSIVIASIGLLALAGINAASVRYSKLSQYRSVAALMAQDLADRMRANRGSTANVVQSYVLQQSFTAQASLGSAPSPSCTLTTDSCTQAEMAAADLFAWRQAVRNNLPQGSVYVEGAATGSVNLWIVWQDAQLGADDEYSELSAKDCHTSLGIHDKSVRCMFFRIQV